MAVSEIQVLGLVFTGGQAGDAPVGEEMLAEVLPASRSGRWAATAPGQHDEPLPRPAIRWTKKSESFLDLYSHSLAAGSPTELLTCPDRFLGASLEPMWPTLIIQA